MSGYKAEHNAASDRLATARIALEDLDAQVSRFESEIDAVRQREDRDRSLLSSGATDAKQIVRSAARAGDPATPPDSLEDSLLEVMESREEVDAQQAAELQAIDALQADLASRAAGARRRPRRESSRPASSIHRGATC